MTSKVVLASSSTRGARRWRGCKLYRRKVLRVPPGGTTHRCENQRESGIGLLVCKNNCPIVIYHGVFTIVAL
jgi:hypothetical protein